MIAADGHRLAVEFELDAHALHFVNIERDLKGHQIAGVRNHRALARPAAAATVSSTAICTSCVSPSLVTHAKPGRAAIGR